MPCSESSFLSPIMTSMPCFQQQPAAHSCGTTWFATISGASLRTHSRRSTCTSLSGNSSLIRIDPSLESLYHQPKANTILYTCSIPCETTSLNLVTSPAHCISLAGRFRLTDTTFPCMNTEVTPSSQAIVTKEDPAGELVVLTSAVLLVASCALSFSGCVAQGEYQIESQIPIFNSHFQARSIHTSFTLV